MTLLKMLIYGSSGSGKTSLALTAPKPLFLLDVDGTATHPSVFVDGSRVGLDFVSVQVDEPFPEVLPDVVVGDVSCFEDAEKFIERFVSEDHGFRSFVLDSVSWMQNDVKDSIYARDDSVVKLTQTHFQEIKNRIEPLLRRCLQRAKRLSGLECMVFTASERIDVVRDPKKKHLPADNFHRAELIGSLKNKLPGLMQLMGSVTLVEDSSESVQWLNVQSKQSSKKKDHFYDVHCKLPLEVDAGEHISAPDIGRMIEYTKNKEKDSNA